MAAHLMIRAVATVLLMRGHQAALGAVAPVVALVKAGGAPARAASALTAPPAGALGLAAARRQAAARAARHAESAELGMAKLGRVLEELLVGRVGAGPATLDIVDAEGIEIAGDTDLVGNAEVDALRLGAVAQRGVVEVDAFGSHELLPTVHTSIAAQQMIKLSLGLAESCIQSVQPPSEF